MSHNYEKLFLRSKWWNMWYLLTSFHVCHSGKDELKNKWWVILYMILCCMWFKLINNKIQGGPHSLHLRHKYLNGKFTNWVIRIAKLNGPGRSVKTQQWGKRCHRKRWENVKEEVTKDSPQGKHVFLPKPFTGDERNGLWKSSTLPFRTSSTI